MQQFVGKTEEDALKEAASSLGVEINSIQYIVSKESKGIFGGKKVEISVFDVNDIMEFARHYVQNTLSVLGILCEVNAVYEEDVIKIMLNSEDNSKIIGRSGTTLKSLNDLVRAAVYNHFASRYRVLLDVNGYKKEKYSHLILMAKRMANDVRKTHITAVFDPMTSDERRAVHQAMADEVAIKTISTGIGRDRRLTLEYIPGVLKEEEIQKLNQPSSMAMSKSQLHFNKKDDDDIIIDSSSLNDVGEFGMQYFDDAPSKSDDEETESDVTSDVTEENN